MKFFSKKEKANSEDNNSEIKEQVERELIVHNMPRQEKFITEIVNPNSAGKINLNHDEKHENKKDFKIIGFLIIFFGLIIIGVIVFFTYRYVIAPTAKTKIENKVDIKTDDTVKNLENNNLEPVVEVLDIPDDYTDIDQIKNEEVTIDTATSSELMQEEFMGVEAEELPPLVDTDLDGLFDEEELILGTSVFSKDSDGDTYIDLEELQNNYNPTGAGILEDSIFIKKYQNELYNYSFLYPASWDLNSVNDNLIVFEIEDGSLIQLTVTENYDNLSILNWYQNNFPEEVIVYDKLISKSGYEGVISQSGLNVYLTKEIRKNVFIFSYIPASPERLGLINVFKMMYSSFKDIGNSI